jgi:hypothetical protein
MLGPPVGGKGLFMHAGQIVLGQFLALVSRWQFRRCVERYHGNRRVRRLTCWDQFVVMVFAQLTFRESLRDIVTCLRSMDRKLFHAGLQATVARSTLAEANEHRDWRIWADVAQVFIAEARRLHADDPLVAHLQATAYAFDTTTVDLCLTLFPWAQFRRRKSAVKLHTLIDLRGNIPCFVHITAGSVREFQAMDLLPLEAGAYYMLDRGFLDFARLYRFTQAQAFFVTRARATLAHRVLASRAIDKSGGLRADQTIRLTGPKTRKRYPVALRRISYVDLTSGQRYVFLTNNFTLAASTIAQLYHCRWQVELFFKWIKQYLRIKAFYGTTPNAVKTQIWIALTTYVLVALLQKHLKLRQTLGEILQVLSVALFENIPILQLFSQPDVSVQKAHDPNPLLFKEI